MSEKNSPLGNKAVNGLKRKYPRAVCALEHGGDPWRLLVMARLSAQCTDARVNIVSQELFQKYRGAREMAGANLSDVEKIVRPCGLHRTKARDIVNISCEIINRFGGKVPDSMEELLTLPGVGRKIANLVLGDIYGKPGIVTDTHCIRICGRLGFYPENEKNPVKIEKILKDQIEDSEQSDFCHRLVMFGRDVCTARNPKCQKCTLSDFCVHFEAASADSEHIHHLN
ncbi:MAG: endonuclease III [Clostridia bacterium]|nr:endonuclease III [Clostridia bacterium]